MRSRATTLLRLAWLAGALLAAAGAARAERWPDASAYRAALKGKGSSVFRDQVLRGSQLRRTRIGNELVAHRGGPTIVYRLDDPRAPNTSWAVRLFLNKPEHDRFAAISRIIAASGLARDGRGGPRLFTDFEYQEQGINLDGKWYPLTKMPWEPAPTLDRTVDKLIREGRHAELATLAETFRHMVLRLRGANLAHGDLQHGNVKVVGPGSMLLIDYDDLYAPEFKGQRAVGLGNENYKHPWRTGEDFHLDIDNFPAHVIYTSLEALAAEPRLWDDRAIHMSDGKGGGDNLIFRRSDFREPGSSPVFARLKRSASEKVRKLAAALESFTSGHVSEVPPLETTLANAPWKPAGSRPANWRPGMTEEQEKQVVEEPEEEEPEEPSRPQPRKSGEPPKPPPPGATAQQIWEYRRQLLIYNGGGR